MQNSQCLFGLVDSISSLFPYDICFRHKTFEELGYCSQTRVFKENSLWFWKGGWFFFKGRKYIYVKAETSSFQDEYVPYERGRVCARSAERPGVLDNRWVEKFLPDLSWVPPCRGRIWITLSLFWALKKCSKEYHYLSPEYKGWVEKFFFRPESDQCPPLSGH